MRRTKRLIVFLALACLTACQGQQKTVEVEVEEAVLADDGTFRVKLSPGESDTSGLRPKYIVTPRGRYVRSEPLVNETVWGVVGWPTPPHHIIRCFQGYYYLEAEK